MSTNNKHMYYPTSHNHGYIMDLNAHNDCMHASWDKCHVVFKQYAVLIGVNAF